VAVVLAVATVCAAVTVGLVLAPLARPSVHVMATVAAWRSEPPDVGDPYAVAAWREVNPARDADRGPLPVLEQHACPFAGEWRSERVRCATLVVPADRSDPSSSAVVELAVAVLPATGRAPADDPLLFLQGGPGGASVAWFDQWGDPPWKGLRRDRDIVLLDQRGTGYSTPTLGCDEAWGVGGREVARPLLACREAAVADGAVLAGVSTREHAADVADLRRAMGVEEWNLLGVSYGTRVALAVLRDHPEGIRSVVLDSAYPLDVDGLAEQLPNAAQAFAALDAACDLDERCSSHGDLEDNLVVVAAALDAAPLRFAGVRYDGPTFTNAVIGAMYDDELLEDLPRILADAKDDPEGALRQLEWWDDTDWSVGGPVPPSSVPAYGDSDGTLFVVQCREEYLVADLRATQAALEDLLPPFRAAGRRNVEEYDAACEALGIDAAAEVDRRPAVSDVPALVLAGGFDPVTPPAWGHQAARTLSAATVIELPFAAHGALYGGACASTVTRSFLEDPAAAVDTSCTGQRQRLRFR
jgi:pimeloyl-ACP methyl ester carboxylesterase